MENLYSQSSFSPITNCAKSTFRFVVKSFLFGLCLLIGQSIIAQPLTGTKTIPGTYATLALAITDLNTQGVGAGGVTFNVAAGYTETITSVLSVTATGTAANPILFQKNGVGANPLITAYTGGTATPGTTATPLDGIFRLVGSDYVTIDGIDLQENGANSTTALMEYGYGLFKTSGTDGCQNVTIKNCTITLNRNNVTGGTAESADGSCGIWAGNTLATGNATVTTTATSGSHSENNFYTNTIQNCNTGIYLRGFAATTPFTLYDQNNDVGGADPSTGNTIINYGGGTGATTAAQGIRAIYQNGFNFSFNNINSNDGAGVNHPSTLRGIFMSTGTSSSGDIVGNTVTLHGGGTTSLVAAIENGAGLTAASNTITVSNNTVQNCTYSTATSGAFTGIDVSLVTAANINFNDNVVTGNTLGTAGTGTTGIFTALYVSGAGSNISASFNSVTSNTKNGTSGTYYCLRLGAGTITVTDNVISDNTYNSTSGSTSIGFHGIHNSAGTTSETYLNNTISNLTVTAANTATANAINGFFLQTAGTTKIVANNTIYNLNYANTSTGSAVITGINHTNATTVDIYNNKIYDLIASNGAASTVFGITNGTTVTTCNIYNNLIGNLVNSQASGADMIKGINITNATAPGTNNVSFNTIYINATSSGANFGTSGVFHTTNATATTGMLVLRNNIIVNTSTANGTGLTVAYRRNTTTLTNYGSASNNNLFYAGTPSATNLIFYDGTNSDQTISAYKSRVAPRDAASVSEAPDFLSTTGSDADFLHMDPTTPTQIESGGITISGITTDIDANTRNVTTPDIGADEFAGIPVDLTLPIINYALLNNVNCTTDRNLSATITDGSGINTTGGTKPRLYYKKSTNANTYAGNTNADDGWKYVEASNASSPFSFTTNYALLQSPLIVGDIIQYFVVAQDLAGTPNVAINSGTFATTPASVALAPAHFPIGGTINSYTVVAAGLSGSYTIGAAGSYTSLTGATGLFNALNTNGINGNITVTISDAAISESGAISLDQPNNTNCAGGTFAITIQPAAGVSTILSGSSATALVNINGADNVTFNGLNSGGSAMTIRNISTGGTIRLIADASNITLQNLTIEGAVTSTTAGVIHISTGTTTGNDNIVIQNNTIRDRSDAAGVPTHLIYSSGTSSTVSNGPVSITGNTLKNYTSTGITLAGAGASNGNDNWTISGNTLFQEAGRTSALKGIVFTSTGTNTITENIIRDLNTTLAVTGIEMTDARNTTVSKNRIYNIPSTSGSTSNLYGIYYPGSSGNPASVTIANNMISIVPGFSNSQAIRGIYDFAFAGNTFNAFYNSIYIGGTSSGTAGSWGLVRGTSAPTDFTAKNNIALNARTGGGANHFGGGDQSANTGTFVSDYNILVGTGVTAANYMDYGTSSTGTPVSVTAWQTGPPSRDANSLFSNPVGAYTQTGLYVSAIDLHAVLTSNPASNAGTVVSVTTDFDNDARSGSTPDIGADEFTATAGVDVGVLSLVSPPPSGCYSATQVVTVELKNFSPSPIDFSLNNVTVSVTATGGYNSMIVVNSGTLAGNGTQNVILPATINMTANGTYTFNSTGTVAGDINNTNNSMTPAVRIVSSLGGNYDVGAGESMSGGFNTLTDAVAAYNGATCITAPIVFTLVDATYSGSETFPIILNENPQSTAVNDLTIRPAAGVAATISGTSGGVTSALIKLNSADYVTIDGLNTGGSSLTIENTSTTDGTAVIWISSITTGQSAHDNTIANCTLKAGIAQNSSTDDTYGILVCGSTISGTPTSNSAGVDNDNTTITGNTIIKVRYGIYMRGGATANPNTGSVITNNNIGPSAFGIDQIGKVGILVREEDGILISGNDIGFVGGPFANTPSGGVDRVGIVFGTDGSWTPTSVYVKNAVVKQNTIHDIIDERTFSAVGIAVSGVDGSNATNNVIANNMLYNIKANGTGSDQAIGIGLNNGNGDIVVYNTINMTGDTDPDAGATTPTVSNFGISISSTSVTNPSIKDNIVVMDLTSSSAPSIENAAINVPTSYVWGTGASNYNDLYFPPGNTQSNTGNTGGNGGASHTTLANWQAAVSQDANSIYQQPVFTSSTNLHLSTSGNPALDNLGTPIAGITSDFDNDTRNVTTPDMGADEFTTVIGNDVGAIALLAPATTGCFTSTETVTVTIKNHSLTSIDFSVNNVTVSASTTGPVVYSSNTVLNSGTLAGNTTMNVSMPATIDMTANGTYVFTASTSLAGDVNMGNDALMENRVAHELTGSYSIGAGEDYTSLSAAINDYNNTSCFLSSVTFLLTDATYTSPGESFPISINDNPAAGSFSLTIKPETGVNSVITGSAASLIKINGADNVTIDGSNNNSTSRNLTISNTSTGTNSTAIWVSSLGTGLGAGQNTIKNSIIKAGSNTVTSTFGIFVGGASISTTGTGDDNDNLTIQNNDISKAYYGIYARGSATGYLDQLNIINNSIGSNTAADYIGFRGMQIYHADGALIDGNTVFNLISTTTNMRGIELVTGFINSEVNGNLIYEINYTATTNSAGKGITVSSGVDPANVVLSNNVIHSLKGHGSATATNNSWGIMLETGGGYDLYYNSINLSHPRNTTANPTDFHGALYVAAAITDINLRNNILAASAAPGGGGKTYAVYSLGTSSPFTDMDYNIYWTPGLNRFNGILDGDDQLAVDDMQDAFGDNANSMTVDPKFNSATNLTLLPGSPAVGEGAAIGTVTTDYLGVTRNASATTIGAYEHPADQTGPEILTFPLLSTLCTSNLPFSAIITDVNTVNTSPGTKPRLYYKKSTDANTYAGNTSGNNGWKYVEASNSSSPFSFTTNYALLQSAVVAGDIIEYFVVAQDQHLIPNVSINSGSFAVQPASVNLTVAAFPIGGTINSYTIVGGGLSTDVTIGAAGTYTTLSGTGGLFSALNTSGITGNITATILDAAIPETGTVALNQIVYGCGGPYTLTIKPGAGVNTVLSGSSTTPLIDFNGADNVHIDGSNNNTTSKNMIIRNTSTSAGSLRFINGAASNYIENTVFESGVTSTTSGVIAFSTTTSVGNSNNTLNNVDIRDRSDATAVPANGVYSAGISDLLNANNSITNSNIFNFSANGINLTALGLGNNWQLSGLNIYNAQTTPSASTQNGIQVAGGLSHIISDNFIGGNAPGATGLWTNTGNVIITGIGLTNGVASISNNMVANITATNTGTTARIRGISNTSSSYDGITIVGNTIFNLKSHGTIAALGGGSQIVAGIHVFPTNTWYMSIISDNVIHDLVAENTTALTTSNTAVGMLLTNWRGQCFNNTIYNIINKSTGTTAGQPPIAAGIYGRFYSGGFVYNNMISLGHTETNNVQHNGIMIIGAGDTGNFQHYYHNTVHVGGTATGTFSSHAFLRGDNSTTSSSHPVNARNNIFAMSRTGGGSVNYSIANQGTNAATSWVSNYNDLYNVVAANVGFWNATGYDLAGWQSASGGDANSINVAPVFVSTTDLHLTLANASLDNAGTPILGVNVDFDGNGRNIVTPDLGAHEIITSGCSKLITSGADSGAGSLRAAVACAQSGEQLVIDPSVPTITLTSGEIVLGKTLTITGHGMMDVVISGNGNSRIFNLQPTYFLQLEDMSMIAATAPSNGGAIWAQGNMVLKNIRIDSCDEGGIPKAFTVTPGINIQFNGDNELND